MWDLRTTLSHGRISLRRFSLLASIFLLALFSVTSLTTDTAYADGATRTSDGKSITYQSKTYTLLTSDQLPASVKNSSILTNTSGYGYFDSANHKAYLILTSGDATTANNGQYVVYDFNPPNTYKNGTSPQEVTLTTDDTTGRGECDNAETDAIGWVICPVTRILAGGMDKIYRFVANFLEVTTLSNDTHSSIYRMWSLIRDIANLCFVIGFLVIIFSQITNIGISNYGIKSALPRLIIAAIFVNISYTVCAAAVDISNILGHGVHSLFTTVLNQLNVGGNYNTNDGSTVVSWTSMAAVILSGGAGAVALGLSILDAGGAIYIFLPLLVGVILAALVSLIILAARQALIIIMIILSPLAFVAYLLPNTEKYFDKWRESFITLLLLFPIFSVVFSGAQLAGVIIVQNAGGNIITVILGMAVQVAPLFITPILLKFSGGIISRVAGIVNNPNKGLVDRTRNWANGAGQEHKNKVLTGRTAFGKRFSTDGTYNGRGKKVMRGLYRTSTKPTRSYDAYKRDIDGKRKVYETHAESAYRATARGQRLTEMEKESGIEKQRVENVFAATKRGRELEIMSRHMGVQKQEIENSTLDSDAGRALTYRQRHADIDKARVDNDFNESEYGKTIDKFQRTVDRNKQRIGADHEASWNTAIQTDPALKQVELGAKASEVKAALTKSQVDKMHAEITASGSESEHVINLRGRINDQDFDRVLSIARDIKTNSTKTAFAESAKRMAEEQFSEFKTEALKNNVIKVDGGTDIYEIEGKTIRKYSAGIGDEANVFADAIAKSRRDFAEQANAQRELAAHFKVSSSQMAKLSMGREDVIVTDDSGNTYTFSKDNEYVRDMAAEEIFTVGSHNDKMRVIESTGAEFDANGNVIPGTEGENYAYRRTIMQAAIKSGFSKAAPAINDKTLEDINNGRFNGTTSWQYHSLREILEGRLNSMSLSTANVNSLKTLFADPQSDPLAAAQYTKLINDTVAAKVQADPTLNPNDVRATLEQSFADRREDLRHMAATVLGTATIRQNASDESVGELKKFAEGIYQGN